MQPSEHAIPAGPAASFPTVSLERYLGVELSLALLAEQPREHDLFLAAAQLASTRYAISTYLPRRLLARQLGASDAGPWLEWGEGTLLFADVSGSTALAEQLSALGHEGSEIVTATLNSYFGTMIRLIQAAGGDLLTFGGDALLVLFEGADHARTATASALALLRELEGFERHVPGVGRFPLSMHIGVESGRVALVSAGQPDALRYSAMGLTVNAVARAEGYGGRGELVLGPEAWAAVASDALGDEVEAGFMRVRALRGAPAPLPHPPEEHSTPLSLHALAALAQQIDRISPYLPPNLLTRILADPQRPRVEAELRPVTVLFAQVYGLGELVEALPPAQAAAAVDALLRPLQAAVEQFGGFLNKLDLAEEGDKLLAVFGAPVAYEDHAERAARAALAIQQAIYDLQFTTYDFASSIEPYPKAQTEDQAVEDRKSKAVNLRVGLNTGTVFAGNVGTAERKEYTVMGDAVNVAARVMVKAAWGEIRCSAATAALIAHTLVCADPRQVYVKGKSEPLELLRLEGERERPATPLLDDAPLVGRADELAWLRAQRIAASTGQGRVARISGDAGVGKSRLAAALLAEARASGLRVLQVRCLAYNIAAPYTPWGELLRSLCGIASSDSQAVRAQKLAHALEQASVPADWLPLMAELVGLEAADSAVVRALDPQQRQARRFEIVLDLLLATARQTASPGEQGAAGAQQEASDTQPFPLVVLFDNLHWADQLSLDLWQHIAGHLQGAPILLLGLHRGSLGWGSGQQGDGATTLELGPLGPSASSALLAALAGHEPLEGELRERLVARAGGNPLFLEELLRAVQSDAATLDALPDSLSGLLLARIDRLDERSRSLLRVASVIGQRFPMGVLQSVHVGDNELLLRQLAHLDEQDLTSLEREQPERVHLFRHALLQEVVYQSLLYARRRELHRRIGEHLEQRYAQDLAAVRAQYSADRNSYLVQIGRNGSMLSRAMRANGAPIFLLAHHYRLSDAPERADKYLLLAGHIARDDYANDQAVQCYRWALEAVAGAPASPLVWEAREALGDVLCTLGRYEEAQAEYLALLSGGQQDAERRQQDAGSKTQEAGSGRQAAGGSAPTGGLLPLAASAASNLAPASDGLPPAVVAEVLRSLGDALEKQGRYAEALQRLDEAEAMCAANLVVVPPLLVAAIYADMGQVLRRLGEFERALAICQRGLSKIRDDRRSAEDERIEADLQQQLGTIYGMRGDYEQARFHLENALAAQESIDDLYGCARSYNNLGYLAQLQSDYRRAVEQYAQAEQLARKVSAKYVLSSALLNAAYAYYRLDRYGEAEAACRDALALCSEMGDRLGVAQADDTLGVLAYNRGDYRAADLAYRQALAIYREQSSSYQEGNTLALQALAFCGLGDADAARTLAEQALAIAQQIQVPQLQAEALNALAEADLLAATGSNLPAEQRQLLLAQAAGRAGEAAVLAERLGSRLDHGVALRLQGEIAAQRGEPFATAFVAALDIFGEASGGFEAARVAARYGAALRACNDPAAATYRTQAEETFRRIGAVGELRRLEH